MHRWDARDEELADLVFAYARDRLRTDDVPLDHRIGDDELIDRMAGCITAAGRDVATVMRLFTEVVGPAQISLDSPRFLSFIPAAPTNASTLFDMVVSAAAIAGISWLESPGAVHAENQALRVLSDLAGLPEGAGGCFVSGGSAANLSALVVARETARTVGGARRRIAVSDATHASVMQAARILDVDVELVPGHDDRLTGASLATMLASDPTPETICAVVATAGSTNAGIVDDLEGIAVVCRERGLWLHVDAAYGGAALFAPDTRTRMRGIEQADSLVIDPHKWLFAPLDCAALLYRAPERAAPVHAQHASYLDVMHDAHGWNPSDYAYHLTRRARGLPLWFSLAVHGTDAYREAVETVLATTRLAADHIRARPQLELVREPELSVLLFRRVGWTTADYDDWSTALLDRQIAFVTRTSWHDEPVGRIAIVNPETTIEMLDEIFATTA